MKRRTNPSLAALPAALLLALAATGAMAQAVPDAATLERQQRDNRRNELERERLLNPQGPAIAAPPRQAAPASQGPGPSFVLNAVEFSESAFFTQAELDAYARPLIGTSVNFAGVQALVASINEGYRQKGQYLSRAFLPPQSVQGGNVKISLVEARAGATSITGANRMSSDFVRSAIEPKTGQVIDVPELDMKVQRFMRATEADVKVDVGQGQAGGTTDIGFTVTEPAPLGLRAYLSNDGNPLTGRAQAGADLRWFSPLGRGDRLTSALIYSEGVQSLTGNYAIPFNSRGGIASLAVSEGRSKILSGPFASFDVKGRSGSQGLTARHPIGSLGKWQFDGNVAVNRFTSENTIGGVSVGEIVTRSATGGLSAWWKDEDTEFNGNYQRVFARATASTGASLPGRASTFDASLVQRFAATTLVVVLRGQHSETGSLPSLIQANFGGAGTVRGYTAGTLTVDSGYTLSADYHFRVTDNVRAYVFGDTAEGKLTGGASRRLSSAGVGAEVTLAEKTSLSSYVAYALDPGLVTNGGRAFLSVRVTQQF